MSSLDIKKIRNDFPQLNGLDYHYLDSAATSLTPRIVLDSEIEYYTHSRASVHRGLFAEAVRATDRYEETRKKVAHFIGADSPDEVVFTSGATESSNMIARMLEEYFHFEEQEKDIVTTEMEHHGSLIPLQQLAERESFFLKHIPLDGFGLDYSAAEQLITDDTVVVSVMLASNVTGVVNDVRRIADIAHRHGAIMIVDATAAISHISVNVKALGCDVVYFSGHKMFAPTGIGVLWVRHQLLEKFTPVSFGGHMIAHVEKGKAEWAPIPERFEPGTKNISGVIGLGVAIDYLNMLDVQNIHEYIQELTAYAIAKLEKIPGVKVLSEHDVTKNTGVVSFVCDFAHPHDIAELLARDRVAVRPGHHCAIPYLSALGVSATTRASLHVYNTKEDIDALVMSLGSARKLFAPE